MIGKSPKTVLSQESIVLSGYLNFSSITNFINAYIYVIACDVRQKFIYLYCYCFPQILSLLRLQVQLFIYAHFID